MKQTTPGLYVIALIVVCIFCGLVYVAVQQSYRSSADDPQLAIAGDLKRSIEHGSADWRQDPEIDIATSLSPFTILYDVAGNPLRSSGKLNGGLPHLPAGVFRYADQFRKDVFTWQPQPGTRVAMVLEKLDGPARGFVAAGRSLQEVEIRERNLRMMVLIAWLACIGLIVLHFLVQRTGSARP